MITSNEVEEIMSATFDQGSEQSTRRREDSATVDSSFPVGESGRLIVENPRGSIRVTSWDRPEVQVHATKRWDSTSARYESTQIELQQHGDTVVARTVLDPTARFVERGAVQGIAAELLRAFTDLLQTTTRPAAVDYVIQVPRRCDLELKGVSSSIAAHGATGAMRIHSVSGPLEVAELTGELNLGAVSGAITAKRIAGRAHVESVSGEIMLQGELTALRAKTVSGHVDLSGPLTPTGEYEFRSVSGGVTLHCPAETRATVSVKGVSADVSSDLPGRVIRNERRPGSREWQGEVNGGGPSVNFHTVSGHLWLRALAASSGLDQQSDQPIDRLVVSTPTEPVDAVQDAHATDAAPAQPDAPPATPTSPDDSGESAQLRILQAVERGEVSVDEALRELETLRGRTS
jgi:hypothetical protein